MEKPLALRLAQGARYPNASPMDPKGRNRGETDIHHRFVEVMSILHKDSIPFLVELEPPGFDTAKEYRPFIKPDYTIPVDGMTVERTGSPIIFFDASIPNQHIPPTISKAVIKYWGAS